MRVSYELEGKKKKTELKRGSRVFDLLLAEGINSETVLVKKGSELLSLEEKLVEGDRLEILRVVFGG